VVIVVVVVIVIVFVIVVAILVVIAIAAFVLLHPDKPLLLAVCIAMTPEVHHSIFRPTMSLCIRCCSMALPQHRNPLCPLNQRCSDNAPVAFLILLLPDESDGSMPIFADWGSPALAKKHLTTSHLTPPSPTDWQGRPVCPGQQA
jgi:hypothetical protein